MAEARNSAARVSAKAAGLAAPSPTLRRDLLALLPWTPVISALALLGYVALLLAFARVSAGVALALGGVAVVAGAAALVWWRARSVRAEDGGLLDADCWPMPGTLLLELRVGSLHVSRFGADGSADIDPVPAWARQHYARDVPAEAVPAEDVPDGEAPRRKDIAGDDIAGEPTKKDRKCLAAADGPPFPVHAVAAVLDGRGDWLLPLRRWSLAAATQRADLNHPAAESYEQVCGPLAIPSRRTWLLELELEPHLLSGGGTVSDSLHRFSSHLTAGLAHRGIASRFIDDAAAAHFRKTWFAAAVTNRARIGAADIDDATATSFPALGAGPILGADADERAVCCELSGPHLAEVIWVGPEDVLSAVLLRCAAIGVRALVVAEHPEDWHGLAGATGWERADPDAVRVPEPNLELSQYDAVLWDSDTEPPNLRGFPAVGGAASQAGSSKDAAATLRPTLWRVLSRSGDMRKRQLRQALERGPDLVLDARVSGWITLEIADDSDPNRRQPVTVQTVGTSAESALLDAAAREPLPADTLAV